MSRLRQGRVPTFERRGIDLCSPVQQQSHGLYRAAIRRYREDWHAEGAFSDIRIRSIVQQGFDYTWIAVILGYHQLLIEETAGEQNTRHPAQHG